MRRRNKLGVDSQSSKQEANIKDLFSRGCLVHLNVGIWGARTKVKDDIYEDDIKNDKEVLKTTQDLLDKDGKAILEKIKTKYREAYVYLKNQTLPCPIRSLQFVSKDSIIEIDQYLQKRKSEFTQLVKEFIDGYESFHTSFKNKVNKKLYRPEKYPSKERLLNDFYFTWSFRTLSVPEKVGILSPEIYKREVEKAKSEMQDIISLTMDLVKNRFLEKIAKLKGFTTDGKIPKKTVNSIDSLLEKYDQLWQGFIGHTELKKAIEKIRIEVGKIDTDNDDASYIKKVNNGLNELTNNLENLPDFKPKRSLIF